MSSQVFEGAVKIARVTDLGMITIRADLANAKLGAVLMAETDCKVPAPREVSHGSGNVAWMSPDELLVTVPFDQALRIADAIEAGLVGEHALVVNVSDARAVFRLSGKGAREVLAKGAPVDLSEAAFGAGQIRRTRLGQVACAFWMSGEEQFDLICFRSVSAFVFDWLCVAAADGSLPEFL